MQKFIYPGGIYSGVADVKYLATKQLDKIDSCRAISIAISNNSPQRLHTPTLYEDGGSVVALPDEIFAKYTGLVAGKGTQRSVQEYLTGPSGVLSYQIDEVPNALLLIMWTIPYNTIMFGSYVNVALAPRLAAKHLYEDMYNGSVGTLISPSNDGVTSKSFTITHRLAGNITVTAAGTKQCVMTVSIEK